MIVVYALAALAALQIAIAGLVGACAFVGNLGLKKNGHPGIG